MSEPLYKGCYIDYKLGKLIRSDGIEKTIELTSINMYEDYTKIEVLTSVTPSKIEVEYAGYTMGELPAEYQQVEYIESTGTQYIDTNEIANNISEINIKFNLTKDIGTHQGILGGGYSKNHSTFQIVFDSNAKEIAARWGANIIRIDYDTNIHYMNVSTTKCIIDSMESSNTSTINDNRNVYLFARRSDNLAQGIQNYSYCKIYKCEMYNNEGIIHKFIPCYLKDNSEIGLYDLIEEKFYSNQGTGTFLKGNDV